MFKRISGSEAFSAIQSNPKLSVIDVRTEEEYRHYHIPGAKLIPMHTIPQNIEKLNKDEFYLIICEHAVRSVHVCNYLAQQGFTNLVNVDGGMSEYPGSTVSGNN